MSEIARGMAEWHGGVWSEHPECPVADWQYAVANGDTRASYWDWCVGEMEASRRAQS